MDCSWLLEDSGHEDSWSESDPEEAQSELETRLYSIVHHSDLSQPLSPDLAKHYSVQCGDDGKLTVVLKESLENIKSEEVKKLDNFVKDSDQNSQVCDGLDVDKSLQQDVIVASDGPFNPGNKSYKRFRYSDVNLDFTNEPVEENESYCNINYSNLNYFKVTPSFLNKKNVKKLKDMVIPPSFQIGESPDWKRTANESFISVGADDSGSEKDIIHQMVCALKEANPHVSKGRLYNVAQGLFTHNRRKHRKNMKRRLNKANVKPKSLHSLIETVNELVDDKEKESITLNSASSNTDKTNIFEGSVTLNVSPFKPLPPRDLIDLVSEDEVDYSNATTEERINRKSLPKCEIPKKWSKKMIKFYTKPSDRKMKMELGDIFEDLKRRSTDEDWKVDPRDKIGVYQPTRSDRKKRNRKCINCNQLGHLMQDCRKPRKTPTCFLCGLNYHTAYSCPNKICLKCGVNVKNEEYECSSCYFHTFNYDTPCGICGQVTHRTEICPDLWRSFHATVEGDKKIPDHVTENKRKYCCNCASKGHFSHKCPFPSCEGDQISSFVTNYSTSECEKGTTEIIIPYDFVNIFDNKHADRFLQELSNSTNAVIDVEDGGSKYMFRVSGSFEQCRTVRNEIQEYMNNRKRKRQEPYLSKKRRKMS